jgi:hypothetical protein
VLLVDDDEANVGERRKERGAGAHHHVDGTLAHEVPLVEALAGGQARVEHGHVVAKARAEAAHGLRRERDLWHEDQGAFARGKRALDGLEVDLGLAGTGDAVHENHVSRRAGAGLVNGSNGCELAFCEALGTRGVRRGERGLLAAANLAARLNAHHATLRQHGHGSRGAGDGSRELGQAHGTCGERLQDLALTTGVARGLEALGARGERDPASVGGRGLLGDKLPRGVRRLAGHADLLAWREEEPHRICERAGVLVRDPARHGSGVRAKRRGREHLHHRKQARRGDVFWRLV